MACGAKFKARAARALSRLIGLHCLFTSLLLSFGASRIVSTANIRV